MAMIYFAQHHQPLFQRQLLNRDQIQVFIFLLLISLSNYFKCFVFKSSSIGSLRSPRQRRQRTTSVNNPTIKTSDATELILRTTNNRTIYTAGRPPWYNCAGQQVEPFVIGLFVNVFL